MHLFDKKIWKKTLSVSFALTLACVGVNTNRISYADDAVESSVVEIVNDDNGNVDNGYEDIKIGDANHELKQAKAKNGWFKEGRSWVYYLKGVKQRGWVKSFSRWYYMDGNYTMRTNAWLKSYSRWYYFKSNGVMAKNESVRINGVNYWFNGAGVCTTNQAKSANSNTSQATVASVDFLNVRSTASVGDNVIGKIYTGQKVTVLAESNGWTRISANGMTGWVGSGYLVNSAQPVQEITSGVKAQSISSYSSPTTSNSRVNAILKTAYAQIGKPYTWGATGPNSFDCSGLTSYAFRVGGNVSLPRVSRAQATVGTTVSYSNLRAGDLVFFAYGDTSDITHVGIYVGNGSYIHAPQPGENVKVSPLSPGSMVTAKRIIN